MRLGRNKMPAAPSAARQPLSAIARGARAVVVGVLGDDSLAERLRASGLWPGAPVEALARAPFGGPLLVRVHGFRLALRREEAARVEVAEVVVP
jgi:ferrous iron transport protein A